MTVERQQLEQRSLEPVAQCLGRRLLVPDVYLNVELGEERLDVVLVDRAGTGEVHVVEVTSSAATVDRTLGRLRATPVRYRWLALIAPEPTVRDLVARRAEDFLAARGAGRIGLVHVVRMADDELGANVIWKAERFHDSPDGPVRDALTTRRPDMHFG